MTEPYPAAPTPPGEDRWSGPGHVTGGPGYVTGDDAPSHPGHPRHPGRYREAAPVTRPGTVDAAFGLMLLGSLLSLIGLAVTLTHRDEIKRHVLEKTPTTSTATLDGLLTFTIGFSLVFVVLYVALATAVRAGRNWARIVTWVLAGLGVVTLLGTLAQPTIGANRVLGVAGGLVDVAIIVLLALAPSNAWFRARRRY